jgi:long-subunit acyl-CoA synthetase (AMP-forming)
VDETGMYRITGRFKEMIIGAGGVNISPVPIEQSIKRMSKGVISHVQMVGDGREFNVALISLATQLDDDGKTVILSDAGLDLVPGVNFVSQAIKSEPFRRAVEKWVVDTNFDGTVCPSKASMVRRFTILPKEFTVETGELSATNMIRRSHSESRHKRAIDMLFWDHLGQQHGMYVEYVE